MSSLKSKFVYLALKLSKRKHMLASEDALRHGLTMARRMEQHCPPDDIVHQHGIVFVPHVREPAYGFYEVNPRGMPHCDHLVMYVHGAAFVDEISPQHWRFISALCTALKCSVIVPIFPLAPERQHRDIFQMVMECYDAETRANRVRRVTVMGDAAGAGMALALTQLHSVPSARKPDHLVLLSPWLDLTMSAPEIRDLAPKDPWLCAEGLRAAARMYAGVDRLLAPTISPLFGPLENLPQTLVFSGTRDLLHHDAVRLHARATAARADLQLHVYPDMVHAWMLMGLPESRHVIETIVEAIDPLRMAA